MPTSAPDSCRPAVYLAVLLASGLVVLSAAGTLSYRYDPGEQFHQPGSRAAAAALVDGRTLAYGKNLDLRLVLRRLAEESPVPDVLLLGSSVTANARGSMLAGGQTFLNLSVNGGTLVDAVGLLDVYERRGRWPRRVVLWLDGASFDPERRDLRWRSLAAQIDRMSRRLGIAVELPPGQGWLADLRQVLSWSYVTEAARALRRGGGAAGIRLLSGSEEARERVLRPDGSRSWGSFAPDRSAVERAAVEAVVEGYAARLTRFARAPGGLDASPRLRLLEALLAHLASRDVEVTLWTTPLAPGAVAALADRDPEGEVLRAFAELDRGLERTARDHGARFAGKSLPPASPSCGGDGHLDFHHLRDRCLARTLAAALGEAPRQLAREAARP